MGEEQHDCGGPKLPCPWTRTVPELIGVTSTLNMVRSAALQTLTIWLLFRPDPSPEVPTGKGPPREGNSVTNRFWQHLNMFCENHR